MHESVTTATADASHRGQLPHANTFPHHLGLGAFPDLVASAEMTTARARMVSSSSSSSSCTIQSQTDSRPAANVFSLATTGMMPCDVEGAFNESHRRRNDSEAGSVSGWGDIHFGDTTNSNNVFPSDVVLDISSEAVVNTHPAQMVDSSTTMLST